MNEWIKGNIVLIAKGWGWAFLVQFVMFFLAAIAAFAKGTGWGRKWLIAILGGLLLIVVVTRLVSNQILPSEKPVEFALPLSTSTQVVSMVPVPTKDLTPIVIRVITPTPTTTSTPALTSTPTPTNTPTPSNRAPIGLALSNHSVKENQDEGTEVGTFSTTDPNTDKSHTYTLEPGEGGGDSGCFYIEGNTLKTAVGLNFEDKSVHHIWVRTIDRGGLSFEKRFTIEVINVNEPPVLEPIDQRSTTVGKLLTFSVRVSDPEDSTLEFSLSGGAPAGARIDPRTGEFSWTPSSTGTFNVTVIVTETDGHPTNLSDDETITITVVPPPLPIPPTIPLRSECQKWDYFYFHFLNLKPQGVLDLTRSTDDALQIEITDPKLGEYIIRYHPLDSPVKLAMEEWPIIWQCEEPGVSCRKDVDKDQKAIYVDWEWLRKDMTSGWYSLVLQVFDKGNWHCVELMPIYIKVPEGH